MGAVVMRGVAAAVSKAGCKGSGCRSGAQPPWNIVCPLHTSALPPSLSPLPFGPCQRALQPPVPQQQPRTSVSSMYSQRVCSLLYVLSIWEGSTEEGRRARHFNALPAALPALLWNAASLPPLPTLPRSTACTAHTCMKYGSRSISTAATSSSSARSVESLDTLRGVRGV